jgi:type I restriction enzyme R subunit
MSYNEAKTRKVLIDPALFKAGWDVNNPNQVGIEIPVDGFDPAAWQVLQTKLKHIRDAHGIFNVTPPAGISDYALYRPNGDIIAIVEAKKAIVDPRLAEAQAAFYVQEIEKRQGFKPFAFLTNGHDIYFWDVGSANKRLVQGFFSPDDLENLLYLREH